MDILPDDLQIDLPELGGKFVVESVLEVAIVLVPKILVKIFLG